MQKIASRATPSRMGRSIRVDISRPRQHDRPTPVDVDLDRVRTAAVDLRLAHLELVMTDERLLQSVYDELRKAKRARVVAAGVACRLRQSHLQRVPIGLGRVDSEDG